MGRPIKKKWFGMPGDPIDKIIINGVKFSDNLTFTEAYIIKQTGSRAYLVQDINKTHNPEIVFLTNASDVDALIPGQCFIIAKTFDDNVFPVEKISQFRLNIYNTDNSIKNYQWNGNDATNINQITLINAQPPVPPGPPEPVDPYPDGDWSSTVQSEGATLTLTFTGTWVPPADSISIQWYSKIPGPNPWVEISGETGSSYQVTADEDGKLIKVIVTGTNESGSNTAEFPVFS